MNTDPQGEARVARLLAASRADADPALLARALARLDAAASEPAWFAWLARPAALAAACGMLALSLSWAWWSVRAPASDAVAEAASPGEWYATLLGDDGSLGLGTLEAGPASGADSGSTR
jgi:hypothetical protein